MPDWTIPALLMVWLVVMLTVHRRLNLWEKFSLALPPIILAAMYFAFASTPVDEPTQHVSGRVVFAAMLVWQTVLLILTRKRHF